MPVSQPRALLRYSRSRAHRYKPTRRLPRLRHGTSAVFLGKNEVACCVSCGALPARHHRLGIDQLLALTVAAAVLFLIAGANPVLAIEVSGLRKDRKGLWHQQHAFVGGTIPLAPQQLVRGVELEWGEFFHGRYAALSAPTPAA